MPLGTKVGLSPGDSVLDGDPAPLPKKEAEPGGRAPEFSAHVYCGQTAGWINWHGGMALGPVHIVLDMDIASLPKKGAEPPPPISVHLYCGQTAGCIKMPLGMEVGLSPGDFVLDGDPAPYPKRGGAPPNFLPTSMWPYGCMDKDATWYGGRPRPTRHCVRCGPATFRKKGTPTPTQFLAHVYCG